MKAIFSIILTILVISVTPLLHYSEFEITADHNLTEMSCETTSCCAAPSPSIEKTSCCCSKNICMPSSSASTVITIAFLSSTPNWELEMNKRKDNFQSFSYQNLYSKDFQTSCWNPPKVA